MADNLYKYSNMLRDFILDELSGPSNKRTDTHRYNNLKITMDLDRFPMPHICVRIAISEGVFALESGTLVYGSIGNDQKYIKKWLKRGTIYSELLQIWSSEKLIKQKDLQEKRDELANENNENNENDNFNQEDDFF